jgi:hypothetical protein
MNQTFSISDMGGFVYAIRDGAAKSIHDNYTEDLDSFVTLNQVTQLVIDNSLGKDEFGEYLITEEIFDTIFEEIRDGIYQAGLSKLAAKGYVECSWDDDNNQMVFWLSSKSGQLDINSFPSNIE